MSFRLAWGAAVLALVLSMSVSASVQQAPSGMQDMMKMHEQMTAEMKAADARLAALVKEMNAASGDARVDAVAAVVNELVRQHQAMHQHMAQMHPHMTGGARHEGHAGMMRGQ